MTDQAPSAPAAEAAPAIPETFSDAREAARFFVSSLEKREQKPNPESNPQISPAERAEEPATAEHESADEADTAPREEAHGETTETEPEADELPPIEPPRSWTKAEKERFATLPRDTQEYLHSREQEREREFRRSQNEIAEQRKAIETERKAAEQARQQYETGLVAQRQALHDVNNREFADIKSMADVEKIANAAAYYAENGDPVKAQQLHAYLSRWQVHQQKMAVVEAEFKQAEARKETERTTEWQNHVKSENAKFFETLAEADKGKLKGFLDAAPAFLEERGFSNKELNDLAEGRSKLSLYDHRVQSLILDGMKFRDMQKAAQAAVTKPVPPVQRPGARPSGNTAAERTQALTNRLNQSGNLDDAVALLVARRSGSRRS